ncbi:TetR/AcrR family transcriptional regulator [Myxococcus stipitatus]|uniref:TetR/AcrR family transcriptional regulator n=1 Tax=Myxococcus stipitatus TaxID=83455 RepID=UPI0030D5D7CF
MSAAIQVLEERGYEGMTLDEVAARAHASKATLYRRWRNKAELVKAALDSLDAEHNAAIPDTGELRSDLIAVMHSLRAKATQPYIAMINDLITASRRAPVLAKLLEEHVKDDELSPFHEVLHRAVKRGVLPREVDTELVHDVAEALVLRQMHIGAPFNARFIHRVVDGALLPLLGHSKRGK